MCSNTRGVASFCLQYSIVGMLFTLMIAMMMTYQPFFIPKIDDHELAKSNAFGAMGTFMFTFILSVVYLVQDSLGGGRSEAPRRRQGGQEYAGVAPPGVMQDYALNLDLPQSVQEGVFS